MLYTNYTHYIQVIALFVTLEMQESAKCKGHFALYNCLVLCHTKYSGVQRVYCCPFPAKPFYSSHRLELIMIRPPGIDNHRIMEPSLCHQLLSGMLGFYFCSRLLLRLTLGPSPLPAIVHSCRHWNHVTILRMVII